MLFVVWFAGQISMPQSDNVTVGIVETDGAHGKEVLEHLTQRESLFSFVMYDNKEALQEDVIAGKLECGFYFSNNFEKKFEHEKLKNSVSYLCTPLTTKGEVARETFYAALFEVYGAQMLSARTEQLFGDDANARVMSCLPIMKNISKETKFFRLMGADRGSGDDRERKTGISTSRTCGIVSVFDHICGIRTTF